MYSSTLLLTSALDRGGWSTPRPGRFATWKQIWYPLCRRLGGSQGRSGRLRKISSPSGFDPRIVQLVASAKTVILGHEFFPSENKTKRRGNLAATFVQIVTTRQTARRRSALNWQSRWFTFTAVVIIKMCVPRRHAHTYRAQVQVHSLSSSALQGR